MISFGCDPEFFLFDKKTNKMVSAHDIVPGTKENPYSMDKYTTIQADGVAVEIGIMPCKRPSTFVRRVDLALENAKKLVGDRYDFAFQPVARFEQDYFDTLPTEVKVLGCSPDYQFVADVNNSYFQLQNEIPEITEPLRVAGGHIHIGWDLMDDNQMNEQDCGFVINTFEHVYYSRFPLDRNLDEKIRRRYYGKMTSGRTKPYGVEIRSPSNCWLKDLSLMERTLKSFKSRLMAYV
jgi:hypothetical protein